MTEKGFDPSVLRYGIVGQSRIENARGEILVAFSDGFVTFENAKRARKWIRDVAMTSVKKSSKSHNGRVWTFSSACPVKGSTPLEHLDGAVKHFDKLHPSR